MSSRTVISAETASGAPQINPWLIGVVVSLAAFMEVLDTSIANVALPHIAGSMGASNFELEITERTLETRKQSLQLTETSERGGWGTLAAVFQAEQLLYTAAAAIPDFERQIERSCSDISSEGKKAWKWMSSVSGSDDLIKEDLNVPQDHGCL